MEFTLVTGRTVAQGEAIETGKTLDKFSQAAAIVELDPEDMFKMGVKEGDVVKVTSQHGSVAVRVVKSQNAPHQGVAFMPLGPWANVLVGGETSGTGMPSFKGIQVKIEPAPEEKVLSSRELILSLIER